MSLIPTFHSCCLEPSAGPHGKDCPYRCELDSLRAQLAQVERERDLLADESIATLSALGVNTANANLLEEARRVRHERDEALAAVEVMRDALERWDAATWDQFYGRGLAVEYAQGVSRRIKDALNLPTSVAKHVEEIAALRRAAEDAICTECEWQRTKACAKHFERCDEPGCVEEASCGWPSPSGYRRTCGSHWRSLGAVPVNAEEKD